MGSKIVILGTGNVAWHLQPAFENSGHVITHIYGRNLKKAQQLVQNSYQAEATNSLDFSASRAEIFLMCLADNGVAEVARELVLPDGAILAYSSGTLSIKSIAYVATENIGVFYRLQTLTRGKRQPFVGNFVVAVLTGTTLFLVGEYFGERKYLILSYVLFAGFITLIREIIKDTRRRTLWLQNPAHHLGNSRY